MKSVYQKLEKVRKPRVHITYDVETEGATLKKELPFVVGVTGDFAGNASIVNKPLKDRKFVQIDADSFDSVMAKIGPQLQLKVSNTLANDGSEMPVELKFNSMSDFEPANIAKQVEPLRKLMEVRTELSELLSKADRSDNLEALLEKILQNQDQLQNLSKDLGLDQPAA
jgi:type VI secretion system protein ImpB